MSFWTDICPTTTSYVIYQCQYLRQFWAITKLSDMLRLVYILDYSFTFISQKYYLCTKIWSRLHTASKLYDLIITSHNLSQHEWNQNGHVSFIFLFQFSSFSSLTTKMHGYNGDPDLRDKIHCVVYVLDAAKYSPNLGMSFVTTGVKEQITHIQENASQRGNVINAIWFFGE